MKTESSEIVDRHETRRLAEGGQVVASLEGVGLRFGTRVIQEGLSCAIEAGELVAVLGPNGAGKTTLLKLLLGLTRQTAGSVRVFGSPPRRGNHLIGYVPQFRVLESTQMILAREVVGFGLDGHRWGFSLSGRERRSTIDRALEEVGALALADRPVGYLSGGEQQRLLIAQALLTNPRLLLLDEPLASLDIAAANEIVKLVQRVRKERNIAVLFVTHDVNPLLRFVDRVLYLANGRSLSGRPEEVINPDQLSRLYGAPVEVVEALGRIFVVGVET